MILESIVKGCAYVSVNPVDVSGAFKILSQNYFVRSIKNGGRAGERLSIILEGPPGVAMGEKEFGGVIAVLESFIPERAPAPAMSVAELSEGQFKRRN